MSQDAEDLDNGVKKLIGKTISHVLRTNNYTVTFRWYGSSNGYYSMCPDTFI